MGAWEKCTAETSRERLGSITPQLECDGVLGITMRTQRRLFPFNALYLAIILSLPLAVHASSLDLAAQPLDQALRMLGSQTKLNVLFEVEQVQGRLAPAVSGAANVDEVLSRLLAGTGLTYRFIEADTVSVVRKVPPTSTPSASVVKESNVLQLAQTGTVQQAVAEQREREPNNTAIKDSGEIIVTGSNIRGAQLSSPVVTITQEEMRLQGHNNLGEVIRALPQNYSGGQNPGVANGANASGFVSNVNQTGGSGVNLRGLGTDATLTLLNGARLPYDGQFQATDLSVIPVAAIERMEVLLDGASAIYGSDAVGGVANIILKKDYQGAELSGRYGLATDGGYEQTQYTGVAGQVWGSGGFLITGDVSRTASIHAGDRAHLSNLSPEVMVYPASMQRGGLFSGHQQLGSSTEFRVDLFKARRKGNNVSQSSATTIGSTELDADLDGLTPSIHIRVFQDWNLLLRGAFGRDKANSSTRNMSLSTGAQLSQNSTGYVNRAKSGELNLEGPLFSVAGADTRVSVGGGYRENTLRVGNLLTGATLTSGAGRSQYGYGEIYLPIFQAIEFNGAARYEDYGRLGAKTTPKAGVIWHATPDLDLKASWGKSFKVPTLREQFVESSVTLNAASQIPGAPAGTTILGIFGGNPQLGPENAEIVTGGVVFHPRAVRDLRIEVGAFSIVYKDRVVQPLTNLAQVLTNPAFGSFVTLAPTVQQQEAIFGAAGVPIGTFAVSPPVPYSPSNVYANIDGRFANAAKQNTRGIDISTRYGMNAFGGRLILNASASWLDSVRKLTASSPEINAAGEVYFPARLRGRFGGTWSLGRMTIASNLNHIAGVRNINITSAPEGGSMTTFDAVLDYAARWPAIGDVNFNFAALNLLNRRPPYLQQSNLFRVNYDSTNYSAIGRTVSLTISKGL